MLQISLIIIACAVLSVSVVILSTRMRQRLIVESVNDARGDDVSLLFPPATRAGILLHRACMTRDPHGAKDALLRWGWATGTLRIDCGIEAIAADLEQPELEHAVKDLRRNLTGFKRNNWSGHELWSAFVMARPEFKNLGLEESASA